MKLPAHMQYPTDEQARSEIIEAGKRMYAQGFVAANDGNISCKVSQDSLWITPSGVSKGDMDQDMLIKLRTDGAVLAGGDFPPSSETTMHLRVYLENPDARAVCHAHPPAATCFAAARRPLDVPILPEAVVNLGRVPVARYATPGSPGVADAVAELCKQGNGLLLANHGVLTWGRHLQQALYCLESLEHTAKIILYGQISECKAVCLTDEEILQLKKLRKKMNGGNQ